MKKLNFEPYDDVQKFDSIRQMLDLADEQAGDRDAFRYIKNKEVKSVTFHEFNLVTEYLGEALCSMGLEASHIANVGENSYDWIVVYLTTLKSSGVFVPVDKELPVDDLINVVNRGEAKVLFFSPKFESLIRENMDRLPNVEYFVGWELKDEGGKFLSLHSLIAKGKELIDSGVHNFASCGSDPDELKMLVYTSGTTGMSKGVMLTEHNLVSSVYNALLTGRVFSCNLSILPYHHTYEAVCSILVSLHNHSTTCINDRLMNVLKNLQRFKPDYTYLVPAFAEMFYKKIWAQIRKEKKEFAIKAMIAMSSGLLKLGIDVRRKLFAPILEQFGGNLVKIVCGGAPLRPEVGEFFESIGIYVINGYGITECSPLVSGNREEWNDCSTVGIPLPCVEIKFEDVDSDGNGEICVRGDVVMKGYYHDEALTAEVLSDDGWFRTGDYGKLNKKGLLCITGRKKNLIVLDNGKNVFPEEIENYILSIDYVKEAVVYAPKDENGQQAELCTEVFPDFDSEVVKNCPDLEQMLKKDIAEKTTPLPVYKKIANVKVRNTEFVKNSSNKIKRNLINN